MNANWSASARKGEDSRESGIALRRNGAGSKGSVQKRKPDEEGRPKRDALQDFIPVSRSALRRSEKKDAKTCASRAGLAA